MFSELRKGQYQQEKSPIHSLAERLLALGIKTSPLFPHFLFQSLCSSPTIAVIHQSIKSTEESLRNSVSYHKIQTYSYIKNIWSKSEALADGQRYS